MVGLQPAHAALGHRLDQLVRNGGLVSPHPGMREHTDPVRAHDEVDRIEWIERVLVHPGAPAVRDELLGERVLLRGNDAGLHHRLRDVRADDVAAARDLPDAVEGDVVAELLELLDDHLSAPEPVVAESSELLLERGVVEVHEVAEDMDALLLVLRGELDPGEELDAGLVGRRASLREALRRVVVGERDAVEAALGRQLHGLRGRERSQRSGDIRPDGRAALLWSKPVNAGPVRPARH